MFDVDNIKKYMLTKKARTFTDVIDGFTSQLEYALNSRVPDRAHISMYTITRMPTYQFAIRALENNSPTQVIKTIQAIKRRYAKLNNIDDLTLGFLDAIEAKAYGYIALNAKNEDMQKSFYKFAVKGFNNAYSRGYYDALLDLADLQKKMGEVYEGEATAFKVLAESKESYTCLGELFYDFSALTESAIRVLEGKRPLISDIMDFKYSMWKYEDGAKKSINSKFYFGLALIVCNEDDSKERGLKIVKETFQEFKTANADCHKYLFESDVKEFRKNIELVENKIIKDRKR